MNGPEAMIHPMNCYNCAIEGKTEGAVGTCQSCGRGVCTAHGAMQSVPQYRKSTAGIGGPWVRASHDRLRWVCRDCEDAGVTAASEQGGGR